MFEPLLSLVFFCLRVNIFVTDTWLTRERGKSTGAKIIRHSLLSDLTDL